MQTTINKSNLMKRAWNIFKGNNAWSGNFSMSLRRAWEIEKANIVWEAKKAAEAAERERIAAYQAERRNNPVEVSEAFMAGCAAYYSNSRPGQYMGD